MVAPMQTMATGPKVRLSTTTTARLFCAPAPPALSGAPRAAECPFGI